MAASIEGVGPRDAAEALARDGIYAWDGDFYATGLIERLGKAGSGGVLRLGLVQSILQIQDQSLPYGAKIICVGITLIVTAPWASREITRFLEHVFTFVAAGRMH